jgi:hypothetical protein
MSQIQRFLIERITYELIEMYMEMNNLEFEDATLSVLESETHMKLTDPETGLYTDSSASIFDLLDSEMKHGRIVQMEQ